MPFLLSPVISHNPSLSWFLITLAVQTDKGQGQPSPRSLTHSPNTGLSMVSPGFLIFALQCILSSEEFVLRTLWKFFISISMPWRNKASKSYIIIHQTVIYGSMQWPPEQLFTYNQARTISSLPPPHIQNTHLGTFQLAYKHTHRHTHTQGSRYCYHLLFGVLKLALCYQHPVGSLDIFAHLWVCTNVRRNNSAPPSASDGPR